MRTNRWDELSRSRWLILALNLAIAAATSSGRAATDYGAITNGAWNSDATWTPAGTPGLADAAYIGSNYPGGAADTATVNLTQNEFADTVYLGYGGEFQGTLDLGTSTLAITNYLYIGQYSPGGTGIVQRGAGGAFTANGVSVDNGNSLTFGTLDAVNYLDLYNASTATTAATGNIANSAYVYTGSTLTLGANMTLTGTLDVEDNSTLDMNGHTINANAIVLGFYDSLPTTLLNRAALTATYLQVGNQTFNLNAADSVANYYLTNAVSTLNSPVSFLELQQASQATTTVAGSVSANAYVYTGSTLTLGANMTLTGTLDVEDNSTLDMNGHTINATSIFLGSGDSLPITLLNRAALTATYLAVGNQAFDLNAIDSVQNYYLYNAVSTLNSPVSWLSLAQGSHATTTTAGSVSANANVLTGSTLTLGANMTLTGGLDVEDNSTLDMGGHTINAGSIALGYYDGQPTTLLNRGTLTAGYLYVGNQSFNLIPADSATTLYVGSGATVTTAVTGNVTGSAQVGGTSTLTLGANMTLTGGLDVEDNSTLDMNGHTINAGSVALGYDDGQPTSLLNRAALTATYLYVGNQTFDLNAADSVQNYYLYNAVSTLNSPVAFLQLQQNSQATTTAAGNVSGYVDVYSGSTLTLGANMTLTGTLDVEDNSTLDMNGHTINAGSVVLGYYDGQPTTLLNRAALTATYLYVGNQTFNLNPADSVQNYYLTNAVSTLDSPVSFLQLQQASQATTTAAGSVSANAYVYTASTLTLGANMTLTGSLDVEDNSTLDMNGHTINANSIFLGYYDGQPTTLLNRAALTATYLYVGNQTFNLNPADSVQNYYLNNAVSTLNSPVAFLQLQQASQATTTTAGSVSANAYVYTTSTLTLGANMTLTGTLDVEDNSALDMNGHTINANSIFLGYYDGQPTTLLNRAALTATYLYVGNQTFNLNPADSVQNYYLNNAVSTLNSPVAFLQLQQASQATTTTAGSVSANAYVYTTSTLTLGANMTLTGTLDVEDNSALDMNGHTINANSIFLGYYDGLPTNLLNRGALAAGYLYVGNQSLNLIAADAATNLVLGAGSQVTTAAAGNVAGSAQVGGTSTLTLGANLTLTGSVNVDSGSTLDMAGHNGAIAGLSGSGVVDNTGPSTTSVLTVGVNNGSSALSGAIQNSGLSATLALTKVGSGVLTLSGANTYGGLTTVKAGTLELVGTSAQNRVLTGGGSDIQGGKIVFDYPDQASTIKGLIKASYNGGLWNTGKFKSTTEDGAHGLGWADNGSSNVIVMYTLYGDANLDGSVNGADLNIVLSNYNLTGMNWSQGDFNYDGTVNGADLNVVLSNYNQSVAISAGVAVPEPATLALLAVGGSDIQGGKIVFDYPDQASTIKGLIKASYNGGLWNTGKFKSTTEDGAHGLGWADNGSSNVIVMYTLYGDANLDGSVNGADLNIVLSNYNLTGMNWSQGDFNYDGTVNGADLNVVLSNYNQSVAISAGVAVPEPATLALLAVGAAGLLLGAWRRKRAGHLRSA